MDFNENNQNIQEIQNNERYTLRISRGTPWVTYILMAINVMIWGFLTIQSTFGTGESYDSLLMLYGMKDNFRILSGEYYRLVTPVFLHANLLHAAVNTYSLYSIGSIAERIFGHTKFFIIYMTAGIVGNIASLMLSPNAGVGASGAIFGLMGALLYLGVEKPEVFKKYFGRSVITSVAINIAYGMSNPIIDNYAHIGGLIGGFLASGAAGIGKAARITLKHIAKRTMYLVLTVAVAASGFVYAANCSMNRVVIAAQQLDDMFAARDWSGVEQLGEEIDGLYTKSENLSLRILWNVTAAKVNLDKFNEALEYAERVREVSPENGYYLLGVVYLNMGDGVAARTALNSAKLAGYHDGEMIDRLLAEIE